MQHPSTPHTADHTAEPDQPGVAPAGADQIIASASDGDLAHEPEAPNHPPDRPPPGSPLHVYTREISLGERTSLSVLAGRVHGGASVLDLGTGSGAIGKFLTREKGCIVDGVTYNDAEAHIAAPHYRRIEIADLDHCDLPTLFAGRHYDYIVCADVLEHIRMPERVVAACHALLAPNGRLLLSIPNTGYTGLIAELIGGEFRYREEGLLDATHVRHFTRQTLLRFLGEGRWAAEAIEPITRALPESEFRAAFDALPPAVARYLLATPDALTYQFIVVARPLVEGEQPIDPLTLSAVDDTPAEALFTAQLFPGLDGGYAESEKLTAAGVIGRERQILTFTLPDRLIPATSLRFDPADRPGFLHLYALRLLDADGSTLWRWDGQQGSIDVLTRARSSQIVLQPPWPMTGAALALLHGDDPWIELPVPTSAVQASRGGSLEVELGWPMSADYLALARSSGELATRLSDHEECAVARIAELNAETARLRESLRREIDGMTEKARSLHLQVESLTRQVETISGQNKDLREQKQALLLRNNTLSRERDGAVAHVEMIENSTVFRATRPVVNAKMKLDRALGRTPAGNGTAEFVPTPEPVRSPVEPPAHPVDVIVPVYKGLADTRLCIESVLKSKCRTPYRLIVINDASPEPQVTQYLRDAAAAEERVTLLENEENLGFVGTVNRGMALSADNDVLLLNSDTEVANDWLDRLRAAAYSDKKVASVTPFSNNATICSYPRFCEDNDLPAGWDAARLDALFASTNPCQTADLPTGIGFCMYVRRDCLTKIGLFDTESFGKGYGEENDFCQRAIEAGWRNVHALDTFVMHSGGVSFGDSKSPRERVAMETLRRMHPTYETQVHTFLAQDPARLARLSVDVARVRAPQLPGVLAVMHDRGGGTARHVRELASCEQGRAAFFTLRPAGGGEILLELADGGEAFALAFQLPHQFDDLIAALRALDVRLIHYHHLIGHDDLIGQLPERLGVAYDFTAHDFYTVCPQITFTFSDPSNIYCGERGVEQCAQCLRRSPAPGGSSIEAWREKHGSFLRGARHVLAPSRDAIQHLARYVPTAHLHFVPHTDIDPAAELPAPRPSPLAQNAPLKVAVIGALSPIKGADVLEDVAAAAAKAGALIDFHLIGFGYRSLRTQPRARLTVHGEYQDKDLAALLDWLKPDLVWFPAVWPETYSYTLSACLKAGLPVVAPDLGAFAERLTGRGWSWVRPWNQTPAQWLEFFAEVRERHFVPGEAPAAAIRLAAVPAELEPALDRSWSYAADYLKGIENAKPWAGDSEGGAGFDRTSDDAEPETIAATASARPTLDRAFLAAHLPDRKAGRQLTRGMKARVLHAALRLRAAPGLSRVARSIPLRWQTRFKNWLRA